MDRRDFMKSMVGLLVPAVLTNSEGSTPAPALVQGGFVITEQAGGVEYVSYGVPKGVICLEDDLPAMLFSGMVMTVKETAYAPLSVDVFFERIISPLKVTVLFMGKYGDVSKAKDNSLRLGVSRTDDSNLWFSLKGCVITQLGYSATAGTEPSQMMCVTEQVHMVAYNSPDLCDKPIKMALKDITDEELRKAEPNWPNIYDRHEELVEAWRKYRPVA